MSNKLTQLSSTADTAELEHFHLLAEHWWKKDGALRTLHHINPTRLKYIESFVNLMNKRILDVGCGGGILSEAMAEAGGDVFGLDAEEEAIRVATDHAKTTQKTIHYETGLLEDFTAPAFEVVTCMEMLEHVNQPALIISNCARLLKPGGYLFLSTLNRSISAYLSAVVGAEYLLKLLPKQTHDYKKFITPAELAAMIRASGLELIDLCGMSYNPFTEQAALSDSVRVNYLMACRKGV